MAGTQGIGTFGINSKFASGSLVFYEKTVGRTATGDVLTIGTGAVKVGGTAQDVDFQFYATGSISMLLDAGAKTLTLDDIDTSLGDNDELRFGDATGGDVVVMWNATNLTVIPATDNTGVFEIGNDGTKSMDVKFYGATASSYLLWDNSEDRLELDGADINLQDSDILQFGDAQDVAVTWNATNLVITPAVDDTGAIYFGNGTLDMDVRIHQGTTTDYVEFDVGAKALEVVGDTRLDLSGATIAAANTDGGVIKGGTAAARIVEDTANMRFINFNFDNGATSGDNRGMYLRLYLTGAAGGGEAARIFTTVEDVAGGTAHGAHISLNFNNTGSITGLGVASRNTLHIANQAYTGLGGTYAATQSEIYSDGANSDPAGMTVISFHRFINDGNASGKADVDDDAFLFELAGFTSGSGKLWYDAQKAAPAVEEFVKVKTPSGIRYLALYDANA